VSAAAAYLQTGNDAIQTTGDATQDPWRRLVLTAPSNSPAFALFRFNAGDTKPATLNVWFKEGSLPHVFVGLANYETSRWEFFDNGVSDYGGFSIDAKYRSPQGNIYAVVVVLPSTSVTFESLELFVAGWNDPKNLVSGANDPSMFIIDDCPAICYIDASQKLMYVRAADPQGQQWGTPRQIGDGVEASLGACSLADINGRPAVAFSYCDNANPNQPEVRYVQAKDADGLSWNTVVTVAQPAFNCVSLATVAGRPAIVFDAPAAEAYYGAVAYVRANDENGASWGTPVILDDGSVGKKHDPGAGNCLLEVDGSPAVSFGVEALEDVTLNGLAYVRAQDAVGSRWNAPQYVAVVPFPTMPGGGFVEATSMKIVQGNPAIAYQGPFVYYVRADDPSGATWGTPAEVDHSSGESISLAVVAGTPAISYDDYDYEWLKFAQAKNPAGAAWNQPYAVDIRSNEASEPTLLDLAGQPAIGYAARTGLTFILQP
jgi:hypothetical protein